MRRCKGHCKVIGEFWNSCGSLAANKQRLWLGRKHRRECCDPSRTGQLQQARQRVRDQGDRLQFDAEERLYRALSLAGTEAFELLLV